MCKVSLISQRVHNGPVHTTEGSNADGGIGSEIEETSVIERITANVGENFRAHQWCGAARLTMGTHGCLGSRHYQVTGVGYLEMNLAVDKVYPSDRNDEFAGFTVKHHSTTDISMKKG